MILSDNHIIYRDIVTLIYEYKESSYISKKNLKSILSIMEKMAFKPVYENSTKIINLHHIESFLKGKDIQLYKFIKEKRERVDGLWIYDPLEFMYFYTDGRHRDKGIILSQPTLFFGGNYFKKHYLLDLPKELKYFIQNDYHFYFIDLIIKTKRPKKNTKHSEILEKNHKDFEHIFYIEKNKDIHETFYTPTPINEGLRLYYGVWK